jgi:hypothetical protein
MPPKQDTTAPDAEVERLYGLEPDAFVAARAEAASELRRQGRRGEAAAVAKLRKPSVAASIANRIARAEPGLVDELLAAGTRLRDVQLTAGPAQDLRAAVEAEQEALRTLMRAAAAVAAGSGSGGQAALERVRETLHAAALDPDLGEQVRRGVLVREQQAAGFPMGVAVPASRVSAGSRPAGPRPSRSPATSAPVEDAVSAKRIERAAAAAATANERLSTAAARLAEAEDDLRMAEGDLAAARRAVTSAERRVERAQQTVEGAQRSHADATVRADEAAARHRELGGSH